MSNSLHIVIKGILQFLFGVLMSAAAFGMLLFSQRHHLSPESWIEVGQETMVFLSALMFSRYAVTSEQLRGGLILIAGFLFSLFIRELDIFFDAIFHGAWKYFLLIFLCGVAYAVRKSDVRTILPGLAHFIESRSFVFMLTGVVFLLAFSRFFGMKMIWEFFGNRCGEGWKDIKTFAEEAMELVGYFFIFASAVNYRRELH